LRIKAAETKNNPQNRGVRTAVVGIGSELNGDDAAGIHVARELSKAAGFPADFLAIDGGSIPENASGPLRKFKPDLVLLVDAADLGAEPGSIAWLEKDRIDGMSASSHTLPLSVLGGYLESELGCSVHYLGIQPAQLEFAADLTPAVAAAVSEIVTAIKREFS
jgi:hydrogenase 3 maturation protease